MQYDSYHSKMKRVAAILSRVYRLRLPILIALAAVALVTAGLLAAKGFILVDTGCPDEVEYGDKLKYTVVSVLSIPSYEYAESEEGPWSEEAPRYPGTYLVRARTRTTGGEFRYGKAHTYTVIPRAISPTVKESRITYGETPTVTWDLAPWDTVSYELSYGRYAAATTTVRVDLSSVSITNEAGESTLSCYTLTTPESSLTIRPVSLEVTVSDSEKVYDGVKLTYDRYAITKGALVEGDYLIALFKASQTDVGSVLNTPRLTVYNPGGDDVTDCYAITVVEGSLTVNPRPLIVRAGSASYPYNGEPQSCTDFTVDPSTVMAYGHRVRVLSSTQLTDCGSVPNVLSLRVETTRGSDVTGNYSLFVEEGTLTVTPREITVTSLDAPDLEYNGMPQSYGEVIASTYEGFDDIKVLSAATVTDVGQAENTVTVALLRGGRDVTENYRITYRYGTLAVRPRPIQLWILDAVKEYDGTPLTSEAADALREGASPNVTDAVYPGALCTGHTLTLRTKGSQTEVGSSENVYVPGSLTIRDGAGKDVTANYRVVNTLPGTLTVTRRLLVVSTPSDEKVYDGTPLTYPVYSANEARLLKGHTLTVEVLGNQTLAGSSENHFTCRITDQKGRDVSEQYALATNPGTLTVIPRPITVSTPSNTWIYDGVSHEVPHNPTCPAGRLLAGHRMETVGDPSFFVRDAGVVENACEIAILDGLGQDVTSNYRVTYVFGHVTVEPRPLTVRTDSETWVYDGKPHTCLSYSRATGLLLKQTLSLLGDCAITDVGTLDNTPTPVITDADGRDVTDNYAVTLQAGVLRVQRRSVNLTANAEKIYDGTPLVVDHLTVASNSPAPLAEGHVAYGQPIETITDVGTLQPIMDASTVYVLDESGRDVTDNYNLLFTRASLRITPRPLFVRTNSAEKVYDGASLFDLGYAAVEPGLPILEGHVLQVNVRTFVTEVGQYPNRADWGFVRVYDEHNRDMLAKGNYQLIGTEEGTLTIKYDTEITVTTGSAEKPFDGLTLFCDEYTVELTGGTLPAGALVSVDVTGHRREVGSSPNTATVTVLDAEGNDITPLVTIKIKTGLLTVIDPHADDSVGRIRVERDGVIYLRHISYGDYTGQGWLTAPAYRGTLSGGYGMSFLPSAILKGLGGVTATMELADMDVFMLPYIPAMGGNTPAVGSDTEYTGGRDYMADYYAVPNMPELVETFRGLPPMAQNLLLGANAPLEAAYRTHVYETYLTVDPASAAYMQGIIDREGFDLTDPSILSAVADYVKHAATYDLEFDPAMENEPNVAIAFLETYRRGVCRHYAAAATLLYRTLGIPARYTTGFMLNAEAGEWTELGNIGHAWVEVYVDGLGWVPVEVTGSSDNGGNPAVKPTLTLIPVDRHKTYDGTYLYAADELMITAELAGLLKKGYTYEVTVSGAQLEVGTGYSTVTSFTLYDPDGVDVTARYEIVRQRGRLTVTPEVVVVSLYQLQKTYDGSPLTVGEGDYHVSYLPAGCTLELEFTVSLTDVGSLTLSDLNRAPAAYVTYRLLRDGQDVTADYPLVFTCEEGAEAYVLWEVTPRRITLTAASETRVADGTTLENPTVYLSRGSLASGHTLEAMAGGSLSEEGECLNEIIHVLIRDEMGRDVTHNYDVTRVSGKLILLGE